MPSAVVATVGKMILRLIIAVTLWAFMNGTPAATYSYPAASEEMYAFELFNS